jgi:hypothetical protein
MSNSKKLKPPFLLKVIKQLYKKRAIKMYLDIGKKCPKKTRIYVPHLPTPITAKQLAADFPEFNALMDGQAKENTLLFYWKYNKAEDVYEFLDTDSEEEVAELLGVELYDGEEAPQETEETHEARQLTEEEVNDFREYIKEFHEGMKEWNERQEANESNKSKEDEE